jgi:hypothetical protein
MHFAKAVTVIIPGILPVTMTDCVSFTLQAVITLIFIGVCNRLWSSELMMMSL